MRKQTRTGGIAYKKKKGQGDGGKAASANQKLVSGTFVNLLNSFYACQLVNLQPARPL